MKFMKSRDMLQIIFQLIIWLGAPQSLDASRDELNWVERSRP